MTDQELETELIAAAKLDRNTTSGFTALVALAKRLDTQRAEFECTPRMVVHGSGLHAFIGEFAAQCMLSMVRDGRTPADAVAWLKKAVTVTRGVGGAVKALYGVTCTGPIALADDIVLLPFSQLPPSETRDLISEEHNRANSSGHFMIHGFTQPPAAALYRAGTFEPLFIPSGSTIEWHKGPPGIWFEELDTAALLLALAPKAVPYEAVRWFHHDDPDVARFGQRGFIRHGNDLSASPFKTGEPPALVPESVAGVMAAFRKLDPNDRDRITLALQRVIRSRNHLHAGNRAIDLAIALEVLFMNADRDEHSYKIAIRLSKLLHDDSATRSAAFLETRRLYDVRSKMVHAGRIIKDQWNVGTEKRSSRELVEAADLRTTQAIRKLMERGSIPDADDWAAIELK